MGFFLGKFIYLMDAMEDMKEDEPLIAAAKREIKEETNLDIRKFKNAMAIYDLIKK